MLCIVECIRIKLAGWAARCLRGLSNALAVKEFAGATLKGSGTKRQACAIIFQKDFGVYCIHAGSCPPCKSRLSVACFGVASRVFVPALAGCFPRSGTRAAEAPGQ
jgi:hypothetical protein